MNMVIIIIIDTSISVVCTQHCSPSSGLAAFTEGFKPCWRTRQSTRLETILFLWCMWCIWCM